MASRTIGPLVAEVTGDGFPVLMIHGLGGSSNTFQPQMQALSHHQVIRPDLPGSARSPLPPETLSIEYFAESVKSALRSLGVARAHLVGHSLGTLVCQRIATDEPGLVASLTLFGALTEPPDAARAGLIARAKAVRSDGMDGVADQIVANTLSPLTHAEKPEVGCFVRESVMRQDPEGYARTCEALAKASAVDGRTIKAPTLLVTGDSDPVAPVSMAQKLADTITGATLSVLERCGHWATIEKPQESSRKLADFLQRNQN